MAYRGVTLVWNGLTLSNHIRCQIIVQNQLGRGVHKSRLAESRNPPRILNCMEVTSTMPVFRNIKFSEYFFLITSLHCRFWIQQQQPNEVDTIHYSKDIIWTTASKNKVSCKAKEKSICLGISKSFCNYIWMF